MNKLILLLLFLPAVLTAQNKETKKLLSSIEGAWDQDDNGYVTYQEVIEIPDVNKSELFSRVENYFAYTYKDANSVIQTRNNEQGVIIGKGIFSDVHTGQSLATTKVSTKHIIKIECKDNKVRVTLSLTDYIKKIYSGKGYPTIRETPIRKNFPLNSSGSEKTVMGKSFYKSHLTALSTIVEIAKFLKSEREASDSDW